MDGGEAGSRFTLRAFAFEPGCERAYVESEWRDAIVSVTRGEVELECLSGCRHRVERGDVLWLDGLPLRALHNSGSEPALLLAVSRRSFFEGPTV
jgi:quercetin dioxygenase-like cupin family protein